MPVVDMHSPRPVLSSMQVCERDYDSCWYAYCSL